MKEFNNYIKRLYEFNSVAEPEVMVRASQDSLKVQIQ